MNKPPWEKCKMHGEAPDNVWACPTCLVELRAENERLRSLLDNRPAINAGIVEAYIKWTNQVYASGLAKSPADTAH